MSYLLGAYGFALVLLGGYVAYLFRLGRGLLRRPEPRE